jgi:CRP-like cAMP-binding protein
MAAQMRRLTSLTSDWVFLDLGGRLAKALVTLADLTSPGDAPCTLLIPQARLAEMVGCSRQRVNEALAGFATRGLITREGRTLLLKDRPGLRVRAGIR